MNSPQSSVVSRQPLNSSLREAAEKLVRAVDHAASDMSISERDYLYGFEELRNRLYDRGQELQRLAADVERELRIEFLSSLGGAA